MSQHLENTLLLPDLAAQYADATDSDSFRLLAYALQAFPSDAPFRFNKTRSQLENVQVMRLWADVLVARGKYPEAAGAWKQVAVWCHSMEDKTGAVSALIQANSLLLTQIPTAEALEISTQLIRFLTRLPDSSEKSEAMLVLAQSLLELGDVVAAKILQQEAAASGGETRLDSTMLRARIFQMEGREDQAEYVLDDLEENLSIFPDPVGARLVLGMFRVNLEREYGLIAPARQRALHLYDLAGSEGMLVPQALLGDTLTWLDAELNLDPDVVAHGTSTLELFAQLHLGQPHRQLKIKAALARSLARLGSDAEGLVYAEAVADWAGKNQCLELEQEFTVLAGDLAARDLQGIRAAGHYGSAADLYSENSLERARCLRKCAVQLVASAGEDRERTIRWAMSLLREAGELLHSLDSDHEVASEISAWEFDRLWIRTRRH